MGFDLKTYKTIKEAIWQSTPDNGLLSVYVDKDGKETWFVLGKPSIIFKK
jgi:hypothetical protein